MAHPMRDFMTFATHALETSHRQISLPTPTPQTEITFPVKVKISALPMASALSPVILITAGT